jgi:Spy/CpxP family protein refolding chaperone
MERRSWFKKIGMTVLGLGAIGLLGAFRHGHGGFGHGPGMLAHHLDELLDEVDATPEQREKIVAIKDRLVEKGQALRAGRREGMKDLLAQWRSATIDTAAVHAKIDARAKEMQAFAHEAADAMAEVHGILTPEQREKVAARWQRRMERFGGERPE